MKTKYIKVSVSEKLPEKAGTYDSNLGEVFYNKFREHFEHNDKANDLFPNYWFMEVPDYEDEILELMKKLDTELDFQYKHREMTGGLYECWDELKTLLTKLKTES